MSFSKNEARTPNQVLSIYMKDLGSHDTMTRDEEVAAFQDLDQRVRDCAKVLASAPARFFTNWFSGGDDPYTGHQDQAGDDTEGEDAGVPAKFKSESVKAAQEA
jgi:hypothetical protein